ncbi:putative 4-oxalocrotonate tautomerase [Phaeomoniella chlamydospora]|uniref:Putative 4-oxalocrotonate tautomerase n=1 Tax=Phaeomoniella chlamydospora TaxID=158046 RepID=A0A0G2EKL0_PHACM|nr:putative 4-oxalocrotonate tautomerase [Phaeomoniella chlamydospora]
MPLVKIDLIRNAYTPTEIRHIADTVQNVMLACFNAPPRDRYQIITQHEPYEMICEDTGLQGLPRGEKLIFIQIFQQGRTREIKEKTYAELFDKLKGAVGIGPGDLIISVAANTKEDWSFGAGRAQFLTGEL